MATTVVGLAAAGLKGLVESAIWKWRSASSKRDPEVAMHTRKRFGSGGGKPSLQPVALTAKKALNSIAGHAPNFWWLVGWTERFRGLNPDHGPDSDPWAVCLTPLS